ncbi:MAG: VWA domain-containing protein [Nanoarchaeota archaeon]|nr:VWA domain-containing protein [Nanoarchaeota archaeon]
MEFSFAHPQYLFLLFLVPLLFFIHFLALGNKKKKALKFANFEAIAKIQGIDFFSKNLVVLGLNILIIMAMVLAVSGFTFHTTAESSDFSFVLAIDSSQSMEADDFVPDRITAAKQVASEFIDSAPIDVNMGVISFSSSSRIEIDMTQKRDELKRAVNQIKTSGLGGTDLYEAVLSSTNLMINEGSKSIVLLSDGQINVGTMDDAIDYAKRNDVVVHSIGMGTKEGGNTEFALLKIDEDSLKSIAYSTGGTYSSAESIENLSAAYAGIFKLTKRKVSIGLYEYLIFLAILLLVLEFFLANTRYVNLP